MAEDTKFTRGPWNVQGDGQIWCDDHPIVEKLCAGPWGDVGVDFLTGEEQLVHWWGTVACDEAKANAHLIASAPRLYAALDRLCAAMDELDRMGLSDEFDDAQEALKLARGETQ